MARYRDAKCKLCRRAGEKLFLKGDRCYSNKCAIEKRNFPPGQHGKSRHGKSSKYNMQLREKQKLRQHYGLLEQLSFKQVRHRKAQLPPGPARQVAAREVIEVQHAAAREAEASPALRTARTAVPELLPQGGGHQGRHGYDPAAAPGAPSGQRRVPPRFHDLARPGSPAHPAQPLRGEREEGLDPELPLRPRRPSCAAWKK